MDFLVNELSLHQQYPNLQAFRNAFSQLLSMRNAARAFGREVSCTAKLLDVSPIVDVSMRKAIRLCLSHEEKRSAMIWLAKFGPFWDNSRIHSENEYLECAEQIVTNSAVGEAAFRKLHGSECSLISFSPSNWCHTPVRVIWHRDGENNHSEAANIDNWWEPDALRGYLECSDPPLLSWYDLQIASQRRFDFIQFGDDCFCYLKGVPFAKSSAIRIMSLLQILNQFVENHSEDGTRNESAHQIYQTFFTGDGAWFSDSSSSEKQEFRHQLTFSNPSNLDRQIFCPWHGKERHSLLRIHFSWPIARRKVGVVYVGPKLTKR